jgi:hypothetical protein
MNKLSEKELFALVVGGCAVAAVVAYEFFHSQAATGLGSGLDNAGTGIGVGAAAVGIGAGVGIGWWLIALAIL